MTIGAHVPLFETPCHVNEKQYAGMKIQAIAVKSGDTGIILTGYVVEKAAPVVPCHGRAKQYAGIRIQSMAVQHRTFILEKSSAES